MSDLPRIANVRFLALNGHVTLTDGDTYLAVGPEDAARLLAELRAAVGMRCETCRHLDDNQCASKGGPITPTFYRVVVCPARRDFYCADGEATL